jgi:hypothetical protein
LNENVMSAMYTSVMSLCSSTSLTEFFDFLLAC